jgi:hypothetical protein
MRGARFRRLCRVLRRIRNECSVYIWRLLVCSCARFPCVPLVDHLCLTMCCHFVDDVLHVCWRLLPVCLTMCCHVLLAMFRVWFDDVSKLYDVVLPCVTDVFWRWVPLCLTVCSHCVWICLHCVLTMFTMCKRCVTTCLTMFDHVCEYVDHVFRRCWPYSSWGPYCKSLYTNKWETAICMSCANSLHVVPKPALNWGLQASDNGTGDGRS